MTSLPQKHTEQAVPGSSGPVRTLIRRAPLVSFLILSCLLSWWPGALQAVGVPLPGPPNTGVGPFLAAVLVLGVTQGRAGVRQLLRSMVQWRAPARAYVAGIGLPLLVSGSAVLITVMFGAARPSGSDLALAAQIPIVLVLFLLIPGTGGAWEEPGWRGFALGRLEKRYGVLAGPLVLGGFWVFWHAPLFLTGDILWPDVLVIVAASVVVGAVFHAGKDSVLIAMLFHATNNAVGGSFASPLFDSHDQITLGVITAAGWWLIAAGVLVRSRRARTVPGGGNDHVPSTV
ncbi:CPBP family intramembrane metalloprotease [Kribbella sp. NBC_00482]|uniref:CPBP family intramembrane glutamic endopeptidase n=1 Tax=Kribbella sp. NBC_00482 TaxID=2975968 RepID=UPI002E17648F